jgi:glycosyltransferase involved in cell wall biosynthesis
MNRLSICVITLNEEQDLPRMLKSVAGLAEEIVLVDSGSTDGTLEIARAAGARVMFRQWTGYSDQRNFAAEQAANEWVFAIAPDEELSSELRDSLLKWKTRDPEYFVYEIPRKAWFLGGWVRHSRWYPDWQRRLYDRRKTKFAGLIHESLDFPGKIGRLRGDLLHYTVRNLQELLEKKEEYSTLAARSLFERGIRRWRAAKWLATPWTWIQYFVLGAGFLDGCRGFLIAKLAGQTVWEKYSKLGTLIQQAGIEKEIPPEGG